MMVIGTEQKTELKHRFPMKVDISQNHSTVNSSFIVDYDLNSALRDKNFDGLLSQSFLSQFNVTIHPSRQVIILSPRKFNENLLVAFTAQL